MISDVKNYVSLYGKWIPIWFHRSAVFSAAHVRPVPGSTPARFEFCLFAQNVVWCDIKAQFVMLMTRESTIAYKPLE